MIPPLATDLYQLTMAAGYWRAGLTEPATFELFVRRLPAQRAFLIAAGLEQAIEYLEQLAMGADERAWLRALPQFARVPQAFFDDYLAGFRFTGDVWAMPEGTPLFAEEPILRVTAPLPEAQVVETALLSIVGFQTSVASKAARIVQAAAGRSVVEFGARRAHGIDAAIAAARAAYLGGCDGTSLVEAARRYAIPASGTMAHSWVQAFPTEHDAFREFSRMFADSAVYLLDTYDTLAAARALVASGLKPAMVRLDSGDLATLSREVRRILDEGGLTDTRIFATGDLDEHRIAAVLAAGAQVDGFGVGTSLSTASDAPALAAVYKLVEVHRHHERVAVVKLSPGKHTWPGAKQVWRVVERGRPLRDVIAAADEPSIEGATPLLERVMAAGRRLAPAERLADIRARRQTLVDALPSSVRKIDRFEAYPVSISEALERRRATLRDQHATSASE